MAWTATGCLALALALAASGRLMYATWRRRKVGSSAWLLGRRYLPPAAACAAPSSTHSSATRCTPRPATQAAKAGQELPLGAAALWHDDGGSGGGAAGAGLGKVAPIPVSKAAAYQAPAQEQFAVSPRIEAVHSAPLGTYARV